MNLHTDITAFRQTIMAASAHLHISPVFVEKDYWISFLLSRLAASTFAGITVFKGGTSLSKGYAIINRFSEDLDIAIIHEGNKSGNEIKTIIRSVEKELTRGLKELQEPAITSKGSRFRKSVYEYTSIDKRNAANRIIVEINSFATPFPCQHLTIKSLLFDFLLQTDNTAFIEQHHLQTFKINVLNKEQTLMEKLVSLIRFSFSENVQAAIGNKIRHFYDLYYLANDTDCANFIQSGRFHKQFNKILQHDKKLFDEPRGWSENPVAASPLITNFEAIWNQLKSIYQTELSALAFADIPDEKDVAGSFIHLTKLIT